jgi:hypothetical protein
MTTDCHLRTLKHECEHGDDAPRYIAERIGEAAGVGDLLLSICGKPSQQGLISFSTSVLDGDIAISSAAAAYRKKARPSEEPSQFGSQLV